MNQMRDWRVFWPRRVILFVLETSGSLGSRRKKSRRSRDNLERSSISGPAVEFETKFREKIQYFYRALACACVRARGDGREELLKSGVREFHNLLLFHFYAKCFQVFRVINQDLIKGQ